MAKSTLLPLVPTQPMPVATLKSPPPKATIRPGSPLDDETKRARIAKSPAIEEEIARIDQAEVGQSTLDAIEGADLGPALPVGACGPAPSSLMERFERSLEKNEPSNQNSFGGDEAQTTGLTFRF